MAGMAECLKKFRESEDTTSGGNRKRVPETKRKKGKKECNGQNITLWLLIALFVPFTESSIDLLRAFQRLEPDIDFGR